jgi:T5orf172 domain
MFEIKRIYIMSHQNPLNLSKWYLWKIGISSTPKLRAQQVSNSIQEKSGKPFPIRVWIKIPLFSAKFMEGKAHNLFDRFRSKRVPHGSSGYTEWFTAPNAIISVLLWFILPNFAGKSLFCLAVFLAPIPFDFIAVCIGMAATEWFLAIWLVCLAIEQVTGFNLLYLIKNMVNCLATFIAAMLPI